MKHNIFDSRIESIFTISICLSPLHPLSSSIPLCSDDFSIIFNVFAVDVIVRWKILYRNKGNEWKENQIKDMIILYIYNNMFSIFTKYNASSWRMGIVIVSRCCQWRILFISSIPVSVKVHQFYIHICSVVWFSLSCYDTKDASYINPFFYHPSQLCHPRRIHSRRRPCPCRCLVILMNGKSLFSPFRCCTWWGIVSNQLVLSQI